MARYYYDRYNIVTTNDFYYPEWPEYDRSWGLPIQYVDYYDTPPLGGWSKDFTYSRVNGFESTGGTGNPASMPRSYRNTPPYTWYYQIDSSKRYLYGLWRTYQENEPDPPSDAPVPFPEFVRARSYLLTKDSVQSKGTLNTANIIAEDGTYPDNGIYGSYWYVKKGLVFPEMKIRVDGALKTSVDGWVMIEGVLKKIDKIWTKIDGTLKEVK